MKKIFQIGLVALVLCFSACKSSDSVKSSNNSTTESQTMNPDNDEKIIEKYWKLIELGGSPVVMNESMMREPHIILKKEESRVIGSGSCNNLTGIYELGTGNQIKFPKMISTRMACSNMETETKLLAVLEKVDNYTLSSDGNILSLNKAKMSPLARFEVVYLK